MKARPGISPSGAPGLWERAKDKARATERAGRLFIGEIEIREID
jgi:hypothetical protein